MPDKLCTIQSKIDGIAIVTVSGSPAVATVELLLSLQRRFATLAGDDHIRGVLLTGTPQGFCCCQRVQNCTLNESARLSSLGQQVMFALEKLGKPCLTVIEQRCTDLGLELALASDFIIAGQGASFGFPAIADGMIPFCGGSQRLARLVGKAKTKEIMFTGDTIDGEEAYRIGLVNRLYPSGEALPRAEELLAHICTRSPSAIRIGGEVVNAGYDIDLATACLLERDAFALCFSRFDQREGMQAFLDTRQPQFSGE